VRVPELSVFVIDSAAIGEIGSASVAVASVAVGSSVPAAFVAEAEFVSVPTAVGSTMAVRVYVSVELFESVTI
jgi:hypothetical protein